MGLEIRRVPKSWEHPKYPANHCEPHLRDHYIPLSGGSFANADAEWNEGYAKWQNGFVKNYGEGDEWRLRTKGDGASYSDWYGSRPSPDNYMPAWSDTECTMLMMYENTTEGTPISPAFETPEDLARWLADTGASAFGGMTATYEQWLATCKSGWAVSAVIHNGVLESGAAAQRHRRSVKMDTATEIPPAHIGHNSPDDLPPVEKIVSDLEIANADALARTSALVEKGQEFLRIESDQQDADATEFMVKVRARYKGSEADRVAAKTPWDDRAGAVHAFFKTRILDVLGLAPPKEEASTFDPVERTDLGLGPRINMAQTLFKRAKAEKERKEREAEVKRLRDAEAAAAEVRRQEEAKARAAEDERRRVAASAEAKAAAAAAEAAAAASRKRNVESKAEAERIAAEAERARIAAAAEARRQEEEASAARAARAVEALAEENRLAEERSAAESAASASLADLSRQRGGRGGVSSLRTYMDVRDIDRATLDYAMIGPYLTDKAVRAALDAYADANKATVKAGITSGIQPIKGAVFFESSKNAGRA